MSEAEDKQTFKNMMELVGLISNEEDVVNYLRQNGILSEEEAQEIAEQDGSFNKKSHLFWLIKKKDEGAFNFFKYALNSTGNVAAAEKLSEEGYTPISTPSDGGTNVDHVDAEVTVVSGSSLRQPDQEGMALAVEIEKEFERIQSEQESEQAAEEAEVQNGLSSQSEHEQEPEVTVAENGLVEEQDEGQDQDQDVESEVRVEITAPTDAESEPEVEMESEAIAESIVAEIEEKVEEKVADTPEPEIVPESPRPQKQVTFGAVSEPEPKEFILHQERGDSESPSDQAGSIVAQNRQLFEKSSPNGAGPQVKYSFAKKGGVAAAAPKEEEPKESTVKNLRNFFQKLGSVDTEEGTGVLKRPGVRSGAPNRRTMI